MSTPSSVQAAGSASAPDTGRSRSPDAWQSVVGRFPDNEAAQTWLERIRWPDGPRCPKCGSGRITDLSERGMARATPRPMPYWCTGCRYYFSVRSRSAMAHSNLSLRVWVMCLHMLSHEHAPLSSGRMPRVAGLNPRSIANLHERICAVVRREPLDDARGDALSRTPGRPRRTPPRFAASPSELAMDLFTHG